MSTSHPLLRLTVVSACLLGLPAAYAQTSPSEASAQAEARPESAPLTLEECVARAMKRNFNLQIQAFSTANAKESLVVANADYVPSFTASAQRSGSHAYVGDRTGNDTQTRVGISQKIITGATVNLSSSLDRSSTNALTTGYNPAYDSDVSLRISQPLLQNGGVAANRASIERARLGVDRAGLDYRGSVLDVIRSVEQAYNNLCYVREQLGVRTKSLRLAETLLSESQVRKNVGVATELDVLQAEVGVANARRAHLQAEKDVRDGEDALLNLIGQFEFGTTLGPVSFPATGSYATSFDQSYKLARENQPDLLSSQAVIKQSEIDARTSKNARLPSLDLGTTVGYNTNESTAGRALRELPGSDGYSWQVDLSFRMPWGLKAENARYRSAKNTLNQNRARLQQLEQSLMVAVRTAVRSVETNLESVEISAKATQLSEKKYELEKAKYDNGQSTARRVLEAQDDLEAARVSELQAQVSLRNAISELRNLEGSSLALYGIQL